MRFSWYLTLAAAAPWALIGCGDAVQGAPVDASTSADVVAVDASAEDVAPSRPCALGGTGRLRVSVALDPALERRAPEVWLAARCGDRDVRLVRWDRSPAMVLDGFGPGAYTVFASSFLAAPTTSARVNIDPVSTASLSVTLGAEPPVMATLQAGGVGVAVDAGVAALPDAAGAGFDAAARPSWAARAYVTDVETGASLGGVEVEAVAADPADDGTPRVAVRVVVRNTCTANGMPPCGPFALRGAEVRTLDGETPSGVNAGAFVAAELMPGESTSMASPILVRGALPDERHALRVAVYGSSPRALRAAMRP